MNLSDTAARLSRIPLFQGLDAAEADTLAARVRRVTHPAGSILFLEGDTGDRAYIVISGCIDLVLESMDGEQILLYQIGPDGYFGEMALLDERPRSATAIASSNSELLAISRREFIDYLGSNPTAALRVLRFTVQRLRLADEKIKMLSFLDVAGRLARSLLDLDQPEGKRAPIAVRQDQLAAMIGSRRPTVSTLLSQWRESGYVVTGRGFVIVLDRETLGEIASL